MVKKWRSRLLAQSDNFEGIDEEIKRLGILQVTVNNEPTLLIKRPNTDDQWERIEPGDFIVSYDGKTWQKENQANFSRYYEQIDESRSKQPLVTDVERDVTWHSGTFHEWGSPEEAHNM
ncbi:hypothetical protein [Limosilactobacillus fermentum]|uniref:hypothetical protein n=1 Tax=Limosilactobacillus fermentum TaxID=1613 RepID=UPI0021A325FB|nr:hypothetical protein [Limosilactobacillus fermentum]MCT3427731.1 hypothetical protein [Limosilactobacillus fermentum]